MNKAKENIFSSGAFNIAFAETLQGLMVMPTGVGRKIREIKLPMYDVTQSTYLTMLGYDEEGEISERVPLDSYFASFQLGERLGKQLKSIMEYSGFEGVADLPIVSCEVLLPDDSLGPVLRFRTSVLVY